VHVLVFYPLLLVICSLIVQFIIWLHNLTKFVHYCSAGLMVTSRSPWPCGRRRRSEADWLLGSRVLVPLRTWMYVCCVGCVLCR